MISDIILQAKKLIFLVLQRPKYFFGTQKLMTYSQGCHRSGLKTKKSKNRENTHMQKIKKKRC